MANDRKKDNFVTYSLAGEDKLPLDDKTSKKQFSLEEDLQDIRDRINKNTSEQVHVEDIVDQDDGSYQMAIAVTPEGVKRISSYDPSLLSADHPFLPIVKTLKASNGSLLDRLDQNNTARRLQEIRDKRKKINQESIDQMRANKVLQGRWGKVKNALESEGFTKTELAAAEIIYRDTLGPQTLDLRRKKDVEQEEAVRLYKRSREEYGKQPYYGSALDSLTNLSMKGFEHDDEDLEVKEYFDSYAFDVKLKDLLYRVFASLYVEGVCHLLVNKGKYEPNADGISSIPGKAPSTAKKVKKAKAYCEPQIAAVKTLFKNHLGEEEFASSEKQLDGLIEQALRDQITKKSSDVPLYYTLLNPSYIKIDDSMMFNKQRLVISSEGLAGVRELIERSKSNDEDDKLNQREKELLKLLPTKLKKAAEENEDYILEDELTYSLAYRKRDYERYAKPRGRRVFDSFDYKEELKKMDYATVDGLVNFLLLVNVGDKDSPVTSAAELEAVADALDTPAKAMALVWNHTLKVEKISSTEIGDILGQDKFEPVDQEISHGLAVCSALFDGSSKLSKEAANLFLLALKQEIAYARTIVSDLLYDIYKLIASAAGFDHFPKIRWDEDYLTLDSLSVQRASHMSMADRRLSSVRTVQNKLGLDHDNEIRQMQDEFKLVQDGIITVGSPYQIAAAQAGGVSVPAQPVSNGRPAGEPTGEKQQVDPTNEIKGKPKSTAPSQSEKATKIDEIGSILLSLSDDDKQRLLDVLSKTYDK